MKYIPEKWQPDKLSMYGVTKPQLHAAVERIQLNSFPLVGRSILLLFVVYAILQGFVLKEDGGAVGIGLAVVSVLIIYGLVRGVKNGRFSPAYANHLYAIIAGLVFLSMITRLIYTGEAKQSANIAFYMMAIGVALFTHRWYVAVTAVSVTIWLIGMIQIQAAADFPFYAVVMAASIATAAVAHIALTRIYYKSEVLRIENGRLFKETRQFNRQLEEKVRERTQELQEAYTLLKKLDKTKADFITIASHELRTPLTIANANNQMLMDDDDVKQNAYLQKRVSSIDDALIRMETVVSSMLDMAKIDSQSLDLHVAPMNIIMLIRIVSGQLARASTDRNIDITIEPMTLPDIMGDMGALQKVFHHLIINAIKYTPDGGHITISGRATGAGVKIVVMDTGIGIAPELHKVIFDKFYQTGQVMLHSSGKTTFKGGGSGLGLAIAKGIVEGHNGRLWVESDGYDEERCPGSAFHLILPS